MATPEFNTTPLPIPADIEALPILDYLKPMLRDLRAKEAELVRQRDAIEAELAQTRNVISGIVAPTSRPVSGAFYRPSKVGNISDLLEVLGKRRGVRMTPATIQMEAGAEMRIPYLVEHHNRTAAKADQIHFSGEKKGRVYWLE